MKTENVPTHDIRGIAANAARDLALGLRLASIQMENFEPGQGRDAARDLAEQLSASAKRAAQLYYLESLTQAVARSGGPMKVRRRNGFPASNGDGHLELGDLKDDVGGCYTKVGFALLMECELQRASRQEIPLSVALFKIEPANMQVVHEVAKHGRECCRLLDVLGTIDDSAVAVLLPDTSEAGAQVAAQRFLTSFLSARELAGGPSTERVRVGVASHPKDGASARELLARADERAGGTLLLTEAA